MYIVNFDKPRKHYLIFWNYKTPGHINNVQGFLWSGG